MNQKQAKKESLGLALAKLILVLSIIVSVGLVLGVAGYLAGNEPIKQPQVSPVAEPGATNQIVDETAGWQTYRNEEYGFEVSYPSGWGKSSWKKSETTPSGYKKPETDNSPRLFEVKFLGGPCIEYLEHAYDCMTPPNISISVYDNPTEKQALTYYSDLYPFNSKNYKKMTVNNVEGYINNINNEYAIFITTKNKLLFSISSNTGILNQILSTFKFIEKDETAGWQTYRNEEYGFEVKYPKDYKMYSFRFSGSPAHPEMEIASSDFDVDIRLGIYENAAKLPGNEKNLSLEDWLLETSKKEYAMAGYNIEYLNGIKVFRVRWQGVSVSEDVMIEYRSRIYYLSVGDNSDQNIMKIFNQILSTFKFIEKDSPFSCGISTVDDIDGNTYNTVQIGSQCWMKENLKATKNPEGEEITRYCYDNDPKICETDGGLYNWNTAMNGSTEESTQGICPDGWHVPKNSEWDDWEKSIAKNYLTKTGKPCTSTRLFGNCETAGIEFRLGGSSGFETIFTGSRHWTESFGGRGTHAFFWSSTKIPYVGLSPNSRKT